MMSALPRGLRDVLFVLPRPSFRASVSSDARASQCGNDAEENGSGYRNGKAEEQKSQD